MNNARARYALMSFARYVVKQRLKAKGLEAATLEIAENKSSLHLASKALVNAYLGIDYSPQSTENPQ